MATKPKNKKPQPHMFIDANIFLDFYRSRNEANLNLLERLSGVNEHIICTYQVEMEFLKNRQRVFQDAVAEYYSKNQAKLPKLPATLSRPHMNSKREKIETLRSDHAAAMHTQAQKILENPQQNDRIYRTLRTIFESPKPHVLTRDMQERRQIRRLAWRRFILGYPPRKRPDTSIGDAFNWEWIIYCAQNIPGDIIVASGDSDFGTEFKGQYYINDQLLKEFKDRVGPKRKIIYTRKLSDALKQMHVHIPKNEIAAEREATRQRAGASSDSDLPITLMLLRFAGLITDEEIQNLYSATIEELLSRASPDTNKDLLPERAPPEKALPKQDG